MRIAILRSAAVVALLVSGSGAWAQPAAAVNGDASQQPLNLAPDAASGVTPTVLPGKGISPAPQTNIRDGTASNNGPMQAEELARLVPKDSSQPRPAGISEATAGSYYRFDPKGTNCSLYPARCRGEDY